jgi:hypothetical protein
MTAKLQPADDEPKDTPKRRLIPDHIPRVEVEQTGDADCAQCDGALRRLGEDVTEELEYLPGRFVVNRIVRPRFTCSGCEAFTQAPLPSRPIERGRPGPGLLAHVLSLGRVDKAHPAMDCGELHEAEEAFGCLVVARRDAAKLLQEAHRALDAISPGIAATVERAGRFAVRLPWDDRVNATQI